MNFNPREGNPTLNIPHYKRHNCSEPVVGNEELF